MIKYFIIFAFAAAATTVTAQSRCPRVCPSPRPSNPLCVRDNDGRMCQKLWKCQIDEMNCQRRERGLEGLITTDMSSCRYTGPVGDVGQCFPFDCRTSSCEQANEIAQCYGTRNGCKLATRCSVLRENCTRPPQNQLRRVNDNGCRGMVAGQDLRRCAI